MCCPLGFKLHCSLRTKQIHKENYLSCVILWSSIWMSLWTAVSLRHDFVWRLNSPLIFLNALWSAAISVWITSSLIILLAIMTACWFSTEGPSSATSGCSQWILSIKGYQHKKMVRLNKWEWLNNCMSGQGLFCQLVNTVKLKYTLVYSNFVTNLFSFC